MSYLVLARKWRPQRFEELKGQEPIVKILQNAILQNRVAHAYLFSGPRGVGKTTTARILAKALNCEGGPTPAPCNLCKNCRAIIEGHSVDMIEIDGASNTGVDDVRDLREGVRYAPSTGRYKVYIIDEAHMLSQAAFNALLKTLEEPPSHVVFILATTTPHKIPLTVQSRCQHLPFRRIPSEILASHIREIASRENFSITDSAIDLIVKAADGSMRDALTLIDQLASFSDNITDEETRALLGHTDKSVVLKILDPLIRGNRKELIVAVEEVHETGIDYRHLIQQIIESLRLMFLCKVTGKLSPELTEQEVAFFKETISRMTEEEIHLYLNELIRTEQEIRTAFSARVAFEVGLIRASMLKHLGTVKDAIERLSRFTDTTHTYTEGRPTKSIWGEEGPPKSVDTEPPERDLKQIEDLPWDVVIAKVEEASAALASKIVHSTPVVEGEVLKLQFNGGHSIHADAVKRQLPKLKTIISEITGGRIVDIRVEKVETPSRTSNSVPDELILKERQVLETLGGRIIERRRTNV